MKVLQAPLNRDDILNLTVGEVVLVNGTVYTGRDAAHQRMATALREGRNLPFDPEGQIIYYTGPSPAPPGRAIGSAGPTTSGRMDAYAPLLIERGLKVMIGKGERNQEVKAAMRKHGAIYLAAVGGAGAYLARRITAATVIAYADLGAEAVYRLEVRDFPCIVAIDVYGNDIYDRKEGQGGCHDQTQ